MIETPARITRIEGDATWVVAAAPSSCGACSGRGCGSSAFARMLHGDKPEYRVDNPIGAQPGEAVVIGLPDGALLRAAAAAYVMPLLLLLVAASIGQHFGGELGAALGGLCGLLLAGFHLKRRRTTVSYPVVLRRGETVGSCG